MQSETRIVAVPASADSWTAIGADFTVPAGAKSIKKVIVSISPDFGDPAGVRFAPVYRLLGSGLTEQSPHAYLGPMGNITAETTSGHATAEPNNEVYEVDIPVQTGGTITAQVNTLDEAVTAGTVRICLVYSDQASASKNSMSDYVDAAMTTTQDAWSTVGTLTVPQLAAGNNPKKIREICMGVATDQATLALLRTSARFRITGSGVAEGGLHEYLGPANGSGASTAGVAGYDAQMVRLKLDVPVNAGGQILVEQLLDVETPTAGTSVFGVLYE